MNIKKPIDRLCRNGVELWVGVFWTNPDNLWALKVTLASALMLLPCLWLGEPFVGCTLALGAVGASLAESDDHPLGRLRSLCLTIPSFILSTLFIEALLPHPWAFLPALAVFTFVLALCGGMGHRYNGVTFGVLLVGIYAMLGQGIKPWYYQPILLPTGALIYSLISLFLLWLRPYRLLKEQVAGAYTQLSAYVKLKARLFPCNKGEEKRIRAALAELNIAVARGIDNAKNVLYACLWALEGKDTSPLLPTYKQWMLVQQLHERATSSHQQYDVLSRRTQHPLLIEGMGQLMKAIGEALRRYADTIITGNEYHVPSALAWTRSMVGLQLEQCRDDKEYPALSMLYGNLSRMADLLTQGVEAVHIARVPVEHIPYRPEPASAILKTLINKKHPRFRHALRLTLGLTLAQLLVTLFNVPKGAWMLLTILFVCQQGYVATRQRLVQRIVGTVGGVWAGIALTYLMPTEQGQAVVALASLFTFFYWVRKRYAYAVVFITIFVTEAFNLQTGTGVEVMSYRMVCTLVGAFMAWAAVRYVMPDWRYRNLSALMATATDKTLRYFRTIYDTELRGEVYYHNRRAAHKADNELASAYKSMLKEPSSKRSQLRRAYALAYLHHSLLSYVSALGAHGYARALTHEEAEACGKAALIMERVRQRFENEALHKTANKSLPDKQPLPLHTGIVQTATMPHAVIIKNIAQMAQELERA